MRILAISDHEEASLYEHFRPERWVGRIDLAISCGDLRGDYLSYLVDALGVPLLYVAGNHDRRYHTSPPEGCDDIDGRLVKIGDLRIAGLSGCLTYNAGVEDYQFSERQFRWRVRRLGAAVWRAGGVDLVVSHAAPFRCPVIRRNPRIQPAGLGRPCTHPDVPDHPAVCPEATDRCHQGITSYNAAIEHWKPRWWLHGHNHLEYGRIPRLWWVGDSQVINADGHVVVDTAQAIERARGSLVSGI